MQYQKILPGIFLSRPNRFVARVEVDGAEAVCHVKNTGRCRELLVPGARIYLEACGKPGRKTDFDLIAVEKGERLINMDAQAPNRVFGEWARAGRFIPGLTLLRPETTFGGSRFDFYWEAPGRRGFVEVKGEMDFISRYLQVMLYRYGDRLRYSIDLEEGSKGASIPRMTLQPIVENSIKYGFGEDRDCLEIRISTRIQKGVLSVIIADDGVGIRPELLEELKANLDQGQNQTDHIGIYNVHKRIRLVYGSGYGVGIDSEMEKGTVVTLRVPCEE